MTSVISAKSDTMIELFSGLSARQFAKLVRPLRREGADAATKGRPWSLIFEDRMLLVAAYWRTNLTMRQIAALFGTSKSTADRVIDDLAPKLALRPRQRYAAETALIVDGTLVPTRDHAFAAPSKNYRYSTNHQVAIHADTQLVVAVGIPLPGNRNDCRAFGESGVDHATRTAIVIADGGHPGTRAVIPHRRKAADEPLIDWKEAHNASHRRVRARIEHTFAAMKTWKIMRDCRLRGTGVAEAVAGIARLHNITLAD
jgi:hypothetical protein